MNEKYQKVYVRWIDPTTAATEIGAWTEISDIDLKLHSIQTFGFKIRENEEVMVISHSVDSEEGIDRSICAIIIPKVLITHYWEVLWHPAS